MTIETKETNSVIIRTMTIDEFKAMGGGRNGSIRTPQRQAIEDMQIDTVIVFQHRPDETCMPGQCSIQNAANGFRVTQKHKGTDTLTVMVKHLKDGSVAIAKVRR